MGGCPGTINWSWLEGLHQIYLESSFVWGKDYMIFLFSSAFPSALCRIQIIVLSSLCYNTLLCACHRITQCLATKGWGPSGGLCLPPGLHSSVCTSCSVWGNTRICACVQAQKHGISSLFTGLQTPWEIPQCIYFLFSCLFIGMLHA